MTASRPEEVTATIRAGMACVDAERILPCTNCGMTPIADDVALGKLKALTPARRRLRKSLSRRQIRVGQRFPRSTRVAVTSAQPGPWCDHLGAGSGTDTSPNPGGSLSHGNPFDAWSYPTA